jgi:hypothetical protein
VHWAQDTTMSFLVPPEAFRDELARAGFDILVWNDKTVSRTRRSRS